MCIAQSVVLLQDAKHAPSEPQLGVAPEQSALPVHGPHKPVLALQRGAAVGQSLLPVHFGPHRPELGSQLGAFGAVQSALLVHAV